LPAGYRVTQRIHFLSQVPVMKSCRSFPAKSSSEKATKGRKQERNLALQSITVSGVIRYRVPGYFARVYILVIHSKSKPVHLHCVIIM